MEKQRIDEVEINLTEFFNKIINIRKLLYKAAIVGAVIGVIVSLSIPKQYTVRVTLSPEMGGSKSGNGMTGLAASFFGGGISVTEDALNASLSTDIISSTPFLLELLAINVPAFEGNNSMTLDTYLDEQSSPWWNYVVDLPGMMIEGVKSLYSSEETEMHPKEWGIIELSQEKNEKINILRKKIITVIDKKSAITSISVTLQNPLVTAVVVDSIVYKLQEFIINYRTFKAKEDYAYLEKLFEERKQEYYITQRKYANYVDTHDNLILQSVRTEQERLQSDMNLAFQVYSQVANQLQIARAKLQEEKPVFALVEPAVVPLLASGTGLVVYVSIFTFLSVVCTMCWMLVGKFILFDLKTK